MALLKRRSSGQRGRGKGSRLHLLPLLVAGFSLLLLALVIFALRGGSRPPGSEVVDRAIDSVLVRLGVDKEKVASFWSEGEIRKEKIRISDIYSLLYFQQSLNHLLQGSGAHIIAGVELNRGKSLLLKVGVGKRVTHLLLVERDPLIPARPAKLALILQDFKGEATLLARVLKSDLPLALSFLPGNERKSLQRVQESGKEVFVALPLHSLLLWGMGRWELEADMEPTQLRGRVRKIVAYFPQAAGFDLSLGSEADRGLLPIIQKELRGKYLVVNYQLKDKSLREKPMIVFSEDFIDKRGRKEYILGKLRRLARLAWMKGEAVGVGKLSAQTWQVIEEERPKLEGKGIRFVLPSQVLQREVGR